MAQSDRDKRTAGFEDKPATPEALVPFIDRARKRTADRSPSPPVELKRAADGDGWEWEWPFGDNDQDWKFLVLDAFGTRHANVAAVFLDQLRKLCSREWDAEHEDWKPDTAELASLLAIVSSSRPKNEAQAAMAAQMAAVHLMSMRVADRIGERPWDAKMIGAFAKLTGTFAAQMETMASLQGRGRSTRQKITVRHEKHVHHHQHLHVEGGAKENESQPHATVDGGTAQNERGSALLGQDAGGQVVPLRSGEGDAGMPDARRQKVGRSHG